MKPRKALRLNAFRPPLGAYDAPNTDGKSGGKAEKSPDVKQVEEDLKQIMGTKVTLSQKGKKGRIEIEYYSKEELERLIGMLKTIS